MAKIEEIELGPLGYYIKKDGRNYTIWLNGCRIGRPRSDKPANEIWEWKGTKITDARLEIFKDAKSRLQQRIDDNKTEGDSLRAALNLTLDKLGELT